MDEKLKLAYLVAQSIFDTYRVQFDDSEQTTLSAIHLQYLHGDALSNDNSSEYANQSPQIQTAWKYQSNTTRRELMQHYIDTIEAKSDVFASQLERTVTETEGDTNATRSKLTKSMLSGPPIPDAQQGRQWRTGNSGVSSVLSRIPDERQGNQQVDADEDTDTTEGNIDDDVDTVQPVAMGTLDCIPQQYRSRIKESQLTTVPQTVVISLINTDDNLSLMLPPTARRSIIAKLALIRALENPNSREQSQCLILYICPDDSNLQEIATKLNRWLEKEDLAVDFFPGDKVSAKLYRILVSPKPPKGLALTPEAFVCALMYPRINSSFGSKGCPKLIIINDGTSHESEMLTEAFVLLAKLGKEYKWTALPRVISTGAINLFTILPSSFEAPTTISLLADTASQPMSQMKISFFHLAEKAGLQLEVIEELMQDYAEERLHFVSWPNRVNEMIREAAANPSTAPTEGPIWEALQVARRTNTGFETGKQLLHCLTKLFATPTDTTLLKLAKTLAGSVLERDVSNDSEASQVSYVENQEMPARSEPDVEDLSQRMSQSSISPNRRPKRTGSQFSSPISSSTLRPGSSQSPFVSGNQQKRQKASNEDSEGSATPVDWNVEEIIWEAESEALVRLGHPTKCTEHYLERMALNRGLFDDEDGPEFICHRNAVRDARVWARSAACPASSQALRGVDLYHEYLKYLLTRPDDEVPSSQNNTEYCRNDILLLLSDLKVALMDSKLKGIFTE